MYLLSIKPIFMIMGLIVTGKRQGKTRGLAGQDRESGRIGQERTRQDRTGRVARHDKTGQDRESDRTGQGRTRQDRTGSVAGRRHT